MTAKTTSTTSPAYEQPNIFAPIIEPLFNPLFMGGLALFVLVAMLSAFTKQRPQLSDGRFATAREIKKGRQRGLRQIARQKHNEAAVCLDRLVLSDLQPAVAVVGRSRGGKTRSIIDPGIKSAIDQGWTCLVFDVKGNLMKKHLAYAHSKGFDPYVLNFGRGSDGLNVLDFMKSPSDAKGAYEIANVLNVNFAEPGSKPDSFFSPQGIALLKTIFMLAKGAPYPDLLSAWKLLSLEDLAGRLAAANEYGLFGQDISSWAGEAAMGLRSVSQAADTSSGIVGTAVTHFQNLIDHSILPSLLKSTIPLDLKGKQIIFFQLDEQNEAATAPLVATAIHLLLKRNLNATVQRSNPLGLFLDEFTSIRLPDIEVMINRAAEYGLVAFLGYQSDSQLKLRYSRDYAESILSSCGTKIVFNTGHPDTAQKFSAALGTKDVWYQSQSRSYGKNFSRNTSDQVRKEPLLSGPAINRFETGECVILNPGFDYRPHHLKVPIDAKNDRLWQRCSQTWEQEIRPIFNKQTEQRLKGVEMKVELSDRAVISEAMLPTKAELEALKNAA